MYPQPLLSSGWAPMLHTIWRDGKSFPSPY